VGDLWFLKSLFDCNEPPTILQLLQNTRMFRATELCDKIFALVALSSNVGTKFIDYDKPIPTVQNEALKSVCG
jgi:hypothetical protein